MTATSPYNREHNPEWLAEKRRNRFDNIDSMSPELRSLVNDYGFNVVKSFIDLGIEKPRHIKHLVENVLNEFSPTRGSYSHQGLRVEVSR